MVQETSAPVATALFRSFWMGGYECATHRNHEDKRLDMIAGTQHDVQAESDYALLPTMGMRTARDGLRWHLIEREPGIYDWSSFLPMLEAAGRQGVQIIWDLCHYGWPDYLDLLSPEFPKRFADFAEAAARVVCDYSSGAPFFAPVNEISFFAWAAARGLMYPHAEGKDDRIKRQLVRSAIASVQAIRAMDSRTRFIYPEPVIHVVPQRDRPETATAARQYNESQFQVWDMIAGIQAPELGGQPGYLDIMGANFYAPNEWQVNNGRRLIWDEVPPDPDWRPLHLLLKDIWDRYQRPLFVAETSHVGVGRPDWIRAIGNEIVLARSHGTPLEGVCLYPIIDRYDWGNPEHWHNSGMWDYEHSQSQKLRRVLNSPYAEALREVQDRLAALYHL